MTDLIPGRADTEGTARWTRRFPDADPAHWRTLDGLTVSSVGLGTYLGEATDEHDAMYAEAAALFLALGGNVVDTAVNYRCQRSERMLGGVLDHVLTASDVGRDELVVCTKAGFLPFDGEAPRSRKLMEAHVQQTLIEPGFCHPDEIVAGCHCMAPAFLDRMIEVSRRNLGLATLDVVYLHNPETQLQAVEPAEFNRRLEAAFGTLEAARADGRIGRYGIATWAGLRAGRDDRAFLDLRTCLEVAQSVGGREHGFRVIQLPHNLTMPEAMNLPNQRLPTGPGSTLAAARALGLGVVASASLHQAALSQGLPAWLRRHFHGLTTDAQRALQFTRSSPSVTCALAGMKDTAHVEENMKLLAVAPLTETRFAAIKPA